MVVAKTLYDTDFNEWIDETISLLRDGRLNEVDVDYVIEELESLGKGDKRAVRSHLIVMLLHLLKWQFQPERRSPS